MLPRSMTQIYEQLRGSADLEVVYDDRDAGPGEKLTDAELLGCPLRVVAGRRGLAEGVVEATVRAGGAEHKLPLAEVTTRAAALLAEIAAADSPAPGAGDDV